MKNTIAVVLAFLVAGCASTGSKPDTDVLDGNSFENTGTQDDLIIPDLPFAVLPDMFKTALNRDSDSQTIPDNVAVNLIDVSETFFRLTFNEDTNTYQRTLTTEAKTGDLIEIVVTAVNAGDNRAIDIELVNSIPYGPVRLVDGSFKTNALNGLYRISRNGKDFFPSDAGIDSSEIRFIQWVIFELDPDEAAEFKYRIRINPQ